MENNLVRSTLGRRVNHSATTVIQQISILGYVISMDDDELIEFIIKNILPIVLRKLGEDARLQICARTSS